MTAGWYQSPMDPTGTRRWWDGVRWTDQIQPTAATPPAPPTPRPLASIPHRIAARIADGAIFGLMLTFLHQTWIPVAYDEATLDSYSTESGSLAFPSVLLDSDIAGTVLLVSVVLAALWELYWLLSEGASPGKQLLGLYVLDPTSELGRVEPVTALKRVAHRPVEIIPFGAVILGALSAVSLFFMFQDRDRHQSVMDRFAGTTVHRLPPGSPRFTPWFRIWFSLIVLILAAAFVTAFLDLRN